MRHMLTQRWTVSQTYSSSYGARQIRRAQRWHAILGRKRALHLDGDGRYPSPVFEPDRQVLDPGDVGARASAVGTVAVHDVVLVVTLGALGGSVDSDPSTACRRCEQSVLVIDRPVNVVRRRRWRRRRPALGQDRGRDCTARAGSRARACRSRAPTTCGFAGSAMETNRSPSASARKAFCVARPADSRGHSSAG